MKIAVACEDNMVSHHFGHCEGFEIYEVEDNEIINKQVIENPGHKPGFLPNFLNEMGVNVIISGGMGNGAVEIFNEKNIEVITGAKGNSQKAAKSYLNGELKSTESICDEHEHHGNCGN